MSQKPQVFLSSTWSDLQKHREAVIFTLTSLKWLFEAMEYFGALPGDPLDECLASVHRSDIYIGVVGTRYGSVDSEGVSITQREYEQAAADKKQILIYLIDEASHPVLPRDVETGAGAEKLRAFKKHLKSQHVCALFTSPQDLALKVSIGLTRLLPVAAETTSKQDRIEELTRDVPILLAESGYWVTLHKHVSDLSHIFATAPTGEVRVSDPQLSNLLSAGFIATRLQIGDFTVLKDIMTFDRDFWSLLVLLIKWYGIEPATLKCAIESSEDPVQCRILIKLAGELRITECTEVICKLLLHRLSRFERQLADLHVGTVTDLGTVIKRALSSMASEALPALDAYVQSARRLKRWKQKQILETAARDIRRRNDTKQDFSSE